MLTMLGTFILVPYFAQQALAMDPLTTGLLTLPGGLLMGALGPVVGRIYDARGPRVLLVPGSLLVTGALWCSRPSRRHRLRHPRGGVRAAQRRDRHT